MKFKKLLMSAFFLGVSLTLLPNAWAQELLNEDPEATHEYVCFLWPNITVKRTEAFLADFLLAFDTANKTSDVRAAIVHSRLTDAQQIGFQFHFNRLTRDSEECANLKQAWKNLMKIAVRSSERLNNASYRRLPLNWIPAGYESTLLETNLVTSVDWLSKTIDALSQKPESGAGHISIMPARNSDAELRVSVNCYFDPTDSDARCVGWFQEGIAD